MGAAGVGAAGVGGPGVAKGHVTPGDTDCGGLVRQGSPLRGIPHPAAPQLAPALGVLGACGPPSPAQPWGPKLQGDTRQRGSSGGTRPWWLGTHIPSDYPCCPLQGGGDPCWGTKGCWGGVGGAGAAELGTCCPISTGDWGGTPGPGLGEHLRGMTQFPQPPHPRPPTLGCPTARPQPGGTPMPPRGTMTPCRRRSPWWRGSLRGVGHPPSPGSLSPALSPLCPPPRPPPSPPP